MKLEINLSNKVFFTLIVVVIAAIVAVIAFGTPFTSSGPYHPLQQVIMKDNVYTSVDQFIDTDDGTSGTSGQDGIIDHANYADVAGRLSGTQALTVNGLIVNETGEGNGLKVPIVSWEIHPGYTIGCNKNQVGTIVYTTSDDNFYGCKHTTDCNGDYCWDNLNGNE